VFGTALVGEVAVTADANVPETGLSATGNVGSVAIAADSNVPVQTVAAEGQVGVAEGQAGADVLLVGVEARALVNGNVLIWSRIAPNQNAGYIEESPVQSPLWSEIQPSQTPDYEEVA
jgi:hypothetical protein